jgi:hypothetical protein
LLEEPGPIAKCGEKRLTGNSSQERKGELRCYF